MDELIQLVIKTYGLVGLILLAPIGAVVYLWREHKKLIKEHTDSAKAHSDKIGSISAAHIKQVNELNERIVAAHRERVQDQQQISDRLMQMVAEQTKQNQETNVALERIDDVLSVLKERR